jgi:peptide/nickel transport system permease protein
MLGDGRRFLTTAPHLALAPGALIFVLSVAVHGLADAVRDRLDPRRGERATESEGDAPREAAAAAAPPQREALIEVAGLSVEIPGAGRVVEGVGLHVAPGEAVALVGESGSGKSLTTLALLGLEPAPGAVVRSERLRLAGRDLRGLDAEGWRRLRGARIGYVPQDPGSSLNPVLPVATQVAETLRAHEAIAPDAARERARELLARVRLPDPDAVLDAYPHELSGGMRQRVLLAIALACDPDVILADEPTTALDVTLQKEILALLDEARRERERGLLLVTHDLAVVAGFCDRMVVLRRGRIVETGDVEATLREPRADYTRSLLEAVPTLEDPERPLRAATHAEAAP